MQLNHERDFSFCEALEVVFNFSKIMRDSSMVFYFTFKNSGSELFDYLLITLRESDSESDETEEQGGQLLISSAAKFRIFDGVTMISKYSNALM